MDLTFERIATKNDLELLKFWLEDEELLRMARMRDRPLADYEFEEYLNTLSYFIVVDNLAIGYARIYETRDPNEGEIGIVIAMPEYRKQGIGTRVGQKLIPICLVLGMHVIKWTTGDYNVPSIKLAEKLGFSFYQYIPGVIPLQTGARNALVYRLEM